MENVAGKLKDAIGGLTEILIGAIGLLVVVQIVFGAGGDSGAGIDIIGNITEVVNSFIGAGASLASIVALLIVMSVLNRKLDDLDYKKLKKEALDCASFFMYFQVLVVFPFRSPIRNFFAGFYGRVSMLVHLIPLPFQDHCKKRDYLAVH